MVDIDKNFKVVRLIDIYGNMLTAKQQKILSGYYFDNLSLSEIAENLGVSRQAVLDSISKSTKTLESIEDKLKFSQKLDTLEKDLKAVSSEIDDQGLKNKLESIAKKMRE